MECLEFDADRLLYAVSLVAEEGDNSEEGTLEWRVTTSGRIQSHNGHSQEGDTVLWTVDAAGLSATTMLINLADPAECPSNQLRLSYIVAEDGTGLAELIGPISAEESRLDLLANSLQARG